MATGTKYNQYIIDAISTEGYDVKANTDKEKLQFLYDTFRSEYSHVPATQNNFKEWIQGLPSSFNIEFENYKILELAKKMGDLPQKPTEAQEDKILENYFNFIANKTFILFRKYGIK